MPKETKTIPPDAEVLALDVWVKKLFEQSWGKARDWIATGKIRVNGEQCLEARRMIRPGSQIELDMNAPRPGKGNPQRSQASQSDSQSPLETSVYSKDSQFISKDHPGELGPVGNFKSRIVYFDSHIVVVNKPAGISTVPYDDSERDTLIQLTCAHLGQRSLEVVHRIDKETSGLVVFARSRESAKNLSNQFRFHTIQRKYFALAHGDIQSTTIRSVLIKDRGDGLSGSLPRNWKAAPGEGKESITHVRALTPFEQCTLIECQLETGRTHQIRIHLSEQGHPLLGEKLYIRDFKGNIMSAPRVMLHAAELGFTHPMSGAPMHWKLEAPEDFMKQLESLKKR